MQTLIKRKHVVVGILSIFLMTSTFLLSGCSNNGAEDKAEDNEVEVVSLFAGVYSYGFGSANGIGSSASFDYPDGITSDGANLYVADTYNSTIRKIVIATGEVSTLAGTAESFGSTDGIGAAALFHSPEGVTTDGTNVYVADTDNHTIRKIVVATGEVSTLAGTYSFSGGSSDGIGSAAGFNAPGDITTDGTNLYVADTGNHTIRKIVIATTEVSTLAGTAGSIGSTDGPGAAARFNSPEGVTTDGTNLYVADTGNNAIRKIVIATGEVSTLAGTAISSGITDGTGSAARFYYPRGIAADGSNLYVADTWNHTIRKIVIATGEVSTLAGAAGSAASFDGTGSAARFNYPQGVTTVGTSLFVADRNNYLIRKIIIATGEVSTFAGTASDHGAMDGIGSAARFDDPRGVTTDGTNLYVADTVNSTIRKIVIATKEVSTLAGAAGSTGLADGTGAAARFNSPEGVTTDGTNLYVADTGNNAIRKIVIATGEVSTLARAEARFNSPAGITTDETNLYVADTNNHTIRKIVISTGEVSTLAGTVGTSGLNDGTGTKARFYYPSGITTDGTNLYVADTNNHTIRKIVIATGEVSTLAGEAGHFGSTDGAGQTARFKKPEGIATDGANLYVADTENYTIRKIVILSGEVSTLAGKAGGYGLVDGTGAGAQFYGAKGIVANGTDLYVTDVNAIRKITREVQVPSEQTALFSFPEDTTTDGTNLYVADTNNHTIRKIVISTGEVSTLAGTAGTSGMNDGTGTTARFNYPSGITTDGTNLFVADTYNGRIRKIVITTAEVSTVAAGFHYPYGITTDGANLYVVNMGNDTIGKLAIATGEVSTLAGTANSSGSNDGMGTTARFYAPYGITTDGTNLYVTDMGNSTIRKIVIATAEVSTLMGTAGSTGSTDGIGTAARFYHPYGVTTDGTNLYVADRDNSTIRKIALATAEVSTLAGTAGSTGSTDGIGAAAKFYIPYGITTDGMNLYVADSGNSTIRKIVIGTKEVSTLAGTARSTGSTDSAK